jgi:ATP adenylyltransferase
MNRLHSPWRSEFIDSVSGQKEGESTESPFARAWREPEKDEENLLLLRGERAFIILNRYPYNAGHLLVVPVRECGDLLELSDEEYIEMGRLVRQGVAILREALSPHAFNIGMNLGRTAGAAIESHVHTHIVPRWNGDTNFMPVLGETRVISEDMKKIYVKLRDAAARIAGNTTQADNLTK